MTETIHTPTKLLTVIMRPSGGAQLAEEYLARIDNGQQIVESQDDAFFMRVRRRVAENPELAEKIEVLWIDGAGSPPVSVGLAFEDELHWPRGFMNDTWDEEIATKKARQERQAGTTTAGYRNEGGE